MSSTQRLSSPRAGETTKVCRKSARSTTLTDFQILVDDPAVNRLRSGVLGVFDWLFAEEAEKNLSAYRDELEKLGLIKWRPLTSTVHIHKLTLSCIQQFLKRRAFFLDSFLSTRLLHEYVDRSYVMVIVDRANHSLNTEVVFQVLRTNAALLWTAVRDFLSLSEKSMTCAISCFTLLNDLVQKEELMPDGAECEAID